MTADAANLKIAAPYMSAQALAGTGVAVSLTVSGILADYLTDSKVLTGLSQSLWIGGTALFAAPLGLVAAKVGRRKALFSGYAIGAIGLLTAGLSAILQSYLLLAVGLVLIGANSAAGYQARYAAAAEKPESKAKLISLIIWSTTAGVIVGPLIISAAGFLDTQKSQYAASFLIAAGLTAVAAVLVLVLTRKSHQITSGRIHGANHADDEPADIDAGHSTHYKISTLVRRRPIYVAASALSVAHGTMIAIMSFAAVQLHDIGISVQVIGVAMTMHLIGMYGLAPAFGWLADMTSTQLVGYLGLALIIAAVGLNISGPTNVVILICSLVLLGLGWSASLIGASSTLSGAAPPGAEAKLEGTVDTLMNATAATFGVLAGVIVQVADFRVLNLVLVVPSLAVLGLGLSRKKIIEVNA